MIKIGIGVVSATRILDEYINPLISISGHKRSASVA